MVTPVQNGGAVESAEVQEERGYQFSIRWAVDTSVTPDDIRLMSEAGVDDVDAGTYDLADWRTTVGDYLGLLRRLTEMAIAVRWRFRLSAMDPRPEDFEGWADVASWIAHLPPPMVEGDGDAFSMERRANFDGLAAFDDHHTMRITPTEETLVRAIEAWRATHDPELLTYSRGPGFVRIIDRRVLREHPRASDGDEDIISLVGRQAEIFLFCEGPRSLGQVVAQFESASQGAQTAKFLDLLVGRRLLFRSDDDRFLALPIHRKLVGVG